MRTQTQTPWGGSDTDNSINGPLLRFAMSLEGKEPLEVGCIDDDRTITEQWW